MLSGPTAVGEAVAPRCVPPSLPRPPASGVGARARTGVAWAIWLVVLRQAINVGSAAVLARMLAPREYGLWGMVCTITTLLFALSDGGLAGPTLQRRDLTAPQVQNLAWLNVALGAALCAVCLLAARPAAHFYGEPEVAALTAVISLAFLARGVAVQPMALLQRQMRSEAIGIVEIVAAVTSTAVAIVCARRGAGAWTFVAMTLVLHGVRAAASLALSGFRPAWPRRATGSRQLLPFCGYLAAVSLPIYVLYNVDAITLGRTLGASTLSFYTRAYFLMALPAVLAAGALQDVLVPAVAALQAEPARLAHACRAAVRTVAFLGFPFAALLVLTAPEAVRLVYGPQWLPAVPILRYLTIGAVALPLLETSRWLFVASGHGRALLVATCLAAAVVAGAVRVGLAWGVLGVAAATGLALAVVTPALLAASHRAIGLALRPTLAPLVPLLQSTALMLVGGLATNAALTALGAHWLVVLSCEAAVGACCYAAATARLARPLPLAVAERLAAWMVARITTWRHAHG